MNEIKYGNTEDEKLTFDTRNISLIGANGSGKSSLMRTIKSKNSSIVEIAAQKKLSIKQGQYRGQDNTWLAQNKSFFESYVDGGQVNPLNNNFMQDDFSRNLEIIFRNHISESLANLNKIEKSKVITKTVTKLNDVISVWNEIFSDRDLFYEDDVLSVGVGGTYEDNDVKKYSSTYPIENLSDGERTALYMLVKIILADVNSIIMVDEPETFLNPALLDSLFDKVESMRNDCKFVYFSHDLEFVTTRKDNTVFWIKDFIFPSTFSISKVEREDIPDELIIKVIGAKKEKILFVESVDNKDAKLYQLLYPDFKVWPVGSSHNVINYVKAFNSGAEKFNKKYFGLVDGDFRSNDEINSLNTKNIFVLPVSIFENLFFKEDIISFVLTYLGTENRHEKIGTLKEKALEIVKAEDFNERYKKAKIQEEFNKQTTNLVREEIDFKFDFESVNQEILTLKTLEYDKLISLINTKSIKTLAAELGYTRWTDWQNQVLNIFNTDSGDTLQELFLNFMPNIKSSHD